jgi:hypothetical protein
MHVLTRPRSRNARLKIGDIAILSESFSRRRTSDTKETWLVTENGLDTKGKPPRAPASSTRIEPFIGERIGHVATVQLPSGAKRLKLIGIEELLPDEPVAEEAAHAAEEQPQEADTK